LLLFSEEEEEEERGEEMDDVLVGARDDAEDDGGAVRDEAGEEEEGDDDDTESAEVAWEEERRGAAAWGALVEAEEVREPDPEAARRAPELSSIGSTPCTFASCRVKVPWRCPLPALSVRIRMRPTAFCLLME
jgi:hypothetical protein